MRAVQVGPREAPGRNATGPPRSGTNARIWRVLERVGLVTAPRGESTYHAFISYSHAADGALAPALQKGLQRFAKPWYRAWALRIFRDEASLAANPGLWSSIEHALDGSLFFILLASPGAASSPWVAREAAHWRAAKPVQNLLIGLTEGELQWDERASDFDWKRTNALPEVLRGAFIEEPRFIDLRWAHSGEELSLSHPHFREAVAELAAPLHGVPKDVLAGEEVRQHRRTVRIARAAAMALSCLTVTALLFGAFALLQRNEARRQRDLATARALVAAAGADIGSRLDRAALLSLEAFRADPSAETRDSMIRVIQRTEHVDGLVHVDGLERIALDDGYDKLAAAGTSGVAVWALGPPREPISVVPVPDATAVAFGPHGRTLAVGGSDALSMWTLGRAPRRTRRMPFPGAMAVAFSRGGRRIGVVGRTDVAVFDTETGERLWDRPLGAVSRAAFAPGGALVAVGQLDELRILDLTGDRPELRISTDTPFALAFDSHGRRVAGLDARGRAATVWDTATGAVVDRAPVTGSAKAVAFGPRDELVLGKGDGTVELQSVGTASPSKALHGPSESIRDIEFPSDRTLVTAGDDGDIVLWNPVGSSIRRGLPPLGEPIEDADYAARASALAVGGFGEFVTVWSWSNGRPHRRKLRTGSVHAVAVDATGSRVAVGDGGVTLFDARRRRRLQRPAQAAAVEPLEFSNRSVLAWGTPHRVALWDAAEARQLVPVPTIAMPQALAFGGDGELLAVAGERGTTVWDLDDRSRTTPVRGRAASAVALSRSGRLIATATDGAVVVGDMEERRTRFILRVPQNALATLSFSPDGSTLAVATSEGRLSLLDTERGHQLGAAESVPGGAVAAVDFSADGATVVTAAQSGRITLWDDVLWSDVSAMRRRLCAVAGRSLTRAEWRAALPGRPYRRTCP